MPIETTDPSRRFLLTAAPEVRLEPSDETSSDALRLPEAFVRLVYGRLDPDHMPAQLGETGCRS